jgi:seryl-tRNA synthetase
MFDIKWIRENPQQFDTGLAWRGITAQSPQILDLDEKRRSLLTSIQNKQERRNAVSKKISHAMASQDMALSDQLKREVAALKEDMLELEAQEKNIGLKLTTLLATLPNLPFDDVPLGQDEKGNIEVYAYGEKPVFDFAPREHFDIGEALGMMDFEAAAKLSGARFTVLKGELARLERALGQFMLDIHTSEHGYTEIMPPLLVRDEALFGTNQLPKFEEDLFFTPHGTTRLGLIPTAEVPLTNLIAGDIIDHSALPLRFAALTPCFRSEAGSAGRDTRGMLRQHQFNKVEMVSITDTQTAVSEHERMRKCAETVLIKLGLHFRTMLLCTGDMGFGARKTYDLEVWLPGQGAYREISSCSICGDFQGRRMNTRYRDSGEKSLKFVHTLNGSGVAVGRALIAVLENYQNADGSVTIPQPLRPYMGHLETIKIPQK